MTNYKNPSPVHFAFGGKDTFGNISPCGIAGLWHRGLPYTLERSRVSCGHCRRWLRKNPEVKVVS